MGLKSLLGIKKVKIDKNKLAMQKRCAPWFQINGDKTLRIDYDLNENSVVFDMEGYHGDWTADIFCKYGCFIHIFEPVQKFTDIIQTRFSNNNKIIAHNYGLAEDDKFISITMDEDASSTIKSSENTEEVKLVDTLKFFNEFNIEQIDLMKINIEGGEYDLLEYLIKTGLILKIKNIQVQFHSFVPNAEERMKNIQEKLSETHELTYQYEFVWENWRLK
ncbi:MAG TPA: FkbM family methyltransferase [Candidatus Gastranaerophilales bacterium]|nr:FkbM family methyltransferase [Candidatus Gastranaerophilales bacterium]